MLPSPEIAEWRRSSFSRGPTILREYGRGLLRRFAANVRGQSPRTPVGLRVARSPRSGEPSPRAKAQLSRGLERAVDLDKAVGDLVDVVYVLDIDAALFAQPLAELERID